MCKTRIVIINVQTMGDLTRNKPLEFPGYKFIAHIGDVVIFEAPAEIKEE